MFRNRIKTIGDAIWPHKGLFLVVFFFVFLASYALLLAIDFVPEAPKETPAIPNDTANDIVVPAVTTALETAAPTSIYIEKLDRTVPVLNPQSRLIADLDAALLEGVVRHPDSALLAQDGNIFILGHSSYLPTVLNDNFQAFNGIQTLAWGDRIEVSSGSRTHVFEVEKVYKADANTLTVPIAGDERRLTLATCNSFGSVDDRFIVEAKEVAVRD
jgi:LPXTG-site transpeptidase (sortase) family protein